MISKLNESILNHLIEPHNRFLYPHSEFSHILYKPTCKPYFQHLSFICCAPNSSPCALCPHSFPPLCLCSRSVVYFDCLSHHLHLIFPTQPLSPAQISAFLNPSTQSLSGHPMLFIKFRKPAFVRMFTAEWSSQ